MNLQDLAPVRVVSKYQTRLSKIDLLLLRIDCELPICRLYHYDTFQTAHSGAASSSSLPSSDFKENWP
jgi:hypothetical protein